MKQPDFNGLETHTCLTRAFTKEAGISSRYLYFAKIAGIEGFSEAAQLFQDLAESSVCNAHGSLDFLTRAGDPDTGLNIGDTMHNITAAITSETREYLELYPAMQETATREGFPDIANWLQTITKLKKVHVEKMKLILAQFDQTPTAPGS